MESRPVVDSRSRVPMCAKLAAQPVRKCDYVFPRPLPRSGTRCSTPSDSPLWPCGTTCSDVYARPHQRCCEHGAQGSRRWIRPPYERGCHAGRTCIAWTQAYACRQAIKGGAQGGCTCSRTFRAASRRPARFSSSPQPW